MDALTIVLWFFIAIVIAAMLVKRQEDMSLVLDDEEAGEEIPVELSVLVEEVVLNDEQSVFLLYLKDTNKFIAQAPSIDELVRSIGEKWKGVTLNVEFNNESFKLTT